jgi:hypothetical protein
MVSFSDYWRQGASPRHSLVGIDVSDMRLLKSIDLQGMRVSLVVGPAVEEDYFTTGRPADKSDALPALGLINLSSMLAAYNAQVRIRDLFADKTFTRAERKALSDATRVRAAVGGAADAELEALIDRWVDRVLADEPEVIGLSGRCEIDPLNFVLFARRLSNSGRRVPVVAGGIWQIRGLPERDLSDMDFLIGGEGEVPLLLLCSAISRNWSPDDIPGLCFAKGWQRGVHMRELSHSLDVLPPPTLEGLELSVYTYRLYTGWSGVTIPYRFSVGCPHNCAYCNLDNKRCFKVRSVSRVVRDLEQLHQDHDIEQFFFINSAFNIEPRYCAELLEGMIATGRKWRWADCCRPGRISPALFSKMRTSGCDWLNWGLDTASDRLDKLYRHGVPREGFAKLLQLAHKAGIRNAVNVIVGMPHETDDDLDELLRFLEQQRSWIDHTFVYIYNFIENSDIGRRPERFGLRLAADGAGVDEEEGLDWPQRQRQGIKAYQRVKSVTLEMNRSKGTDDW